MGVDIEVLVAGISRDGNNVKAQGTSVVSGSYSSNIDWEATYSFSATALQKAQACVEAAIDAAAAVGQTVGMLNSKTLYAPPQTITL